MFEFYFQSGEFIEDSGFLADLFVEIIGSFIGVFGALFLYIIQINRDNETSKALKIEFEKDKLTNLNHLVLKS